MEQIAIANGLIDLLEIVIPQVQQAAQKGQIDPDTQAKLLARIEGLRDIRGPAFAGPEWQPSQPPPPPTTPAA